MVIVTPATSIFFFRPEFDDFLYAPIGAHGGEMPLSVLSALARSDLDPWQEAAELSDLPKDIATQRLASLISQLPGGRWTLADSGAIAGRLIEFLPRCGSAEVPLTETSHGLRVMIGSTAPEIADLCCIRRNCVRHRSNERTVVAKQSCGRAGIQHSLPAADVTMMTKMTPFCPTSRRTDGGGRGAWKR